MVGNRFRRYFGLAALAAFAALLAVSCGGKAIPSVAIQAADFSFAGPATLQGGLTRFQLTNSGQDSHHMQLLKLNTGVDQAQFQAALGAALAAVPEVGEAALFSIFEVATLAGGPSGVGPGGSAGAIVNLTQGEYALVCFVAGADGIPHLAKGMVKPLTVTAPAAEQPEAPAADYTVNLNDFAFTGAS